MHWGKGHNFTKLTEKQMYRSLSFSKVTCLQLSNFLKRGVEEFSCELCEIFKSTFL